MERYLEIRDAATCIPALAVHPGPTRKQARRFLRRAGWSTDQLLDRAAPLVFLFNLETGIARHDPHAWYDRTMTTAHRYIILNWWELTNGQVIDVAYILGETRQPKEPSI